MKKNTADRTGAVIRTTDLYTVRGKILLTLVYLLCVIAAVVALFPPLWVFLASFKEHREFLREPTLLPQSLDIAKFAETWQVLKIGRYFVNSLISVAGCTICALVINGLTAYGISIVRPKGSQAVYAMILWSLLIPGTISLVPLFMNINRLGLSGFFTPLWLSFGANAFYVVLYKQVFDALPPSFLVAARMDGGNHGQNFFKIVLPLSKPIAVVIAIYAVNGAWSDFLLPYLVLDHTEFETVMVRLFQFRNNPQIRDVEMLRAIAFSIIPPIIIFLAFQRQITSSMLEAGLRG
jgi:multiple sugar transport system permease protein